MFRLFCCPNLNGKFLGCVSHGEVWQDNQFAPSLPRTLLATALPGPVLFPLRSCKAVSGGAVCPVLLSSRYHDAHFSFARTKDPDWISRTGEGCQGKGRSFITPARGPDCDAAFNLLHFERLIQQVLLPRRSLLSGSYMDSMDSAKSNGYPWSAS